MFGFIGWVVGAALFAAEIWAIFNVFKAGRSDGEKLAWLIGILVLQPFGLIAWALAGPKDTKRLPRL